MTHLITDTGFAPDDWTGRFATLAEVTAEHSALDLSADADVATLTALLPTLRMIRVSFASFADGRGFTIARQLRLAGFAGRLRARGHVLPDQYAMARRAGFDEVEIDLALGARAREDHWQFRANWQQHDYQARLRG